MAGHTHFLDSRGASPALATLQALYVARCYHCWKEPEVLPWLERNYRETLERIKAADRLVAATNQARKSRYQVSDTEENR